MASFIEKLQEKYSNTGMVAKSKRSLAWFRRQVQDLTNVNRSRLLKDSALDIRTKPMPGKMYMFRYDAKTKETLPFWDRFPLIFMVEPAKGGFYGLNLHYLPPTIRAVFFDKLMQISNNKRYDHTTKLKLSYDILKGASRFNAFAPCFKRYLSKQLKSQPTFVPADLWEVVLFLPTEHFIGASKQTVWKNSRSKI